jgi:succinyl-diaminopimelate desuccinylase
VGLDLRGDPIALTAALVDIPSESRDEQRIADEVEAALHEQTTGFEILRTGNTVLARTDHGLPSRVILAGHLDTVPIADNVPSRLVGGELHGCGTSDMKSGDAVFLHLAATIDAPAHDITLVMYDCEEIEASANSLGRIERELPQWLQADVAILGEPLTGYEARSVDIDGCVYREGLSAVRIDGGVAGNVIPDAASATINFRFAPDRSIEQAYQHVREVLDGLDVNVEQTDAAPGALPGLTKPAAAALVDAAGGQVRAKYGWTDVARFAALGVPAVNFGPGDPNFAHRVDERVEVEQITAATDMLRRYLTA